MQLPSPSDLFLPSGGGATGGRELATSLSLEAGVSRGLSCGLVGSREALDEWRAERKGPLVSRTQP